MDSESLRRIEARLAAIEAHLAKLVEREAETTLVVETVKTPSQIQSLDPHLILMA